MTRMNESWDGRVLKWSGLAVALFVFGALLSMARVPHPASAGTASAIAAAARTHRG